MGKRQVGSGRLLGGGLLAAGLLAAGLQWTARSGTAPSDAVVAAAAGAAPGATALSARRAWRPLPAASASLHDPEAFADWLAASSSLRGTELDGAWDVDAQGRFTPTVALRRRFDQLLTLVGEADVEDIGRYVAHEVRAWGGATAEAAVMQAWQRYLALQRHAWRTVADPADPAALAAALDERRQVRRRILGPALAEAFYGADEAALQAGLQAPSAVTAADPLDRSRLDAAAQQRLQQEDAAWADWERRLAQARQDVATLQAAPALSAPQRDEAVARLLADRFTPQEAVRVRALLQLPRP